MNDSDSTVGKSRVLPPNAGKTAESRHRMPSNAGKGRRKGVPNKVTADTRALIMAALHGAGGVSYLVEQARANPVAFLVLLGKLVPTKVETPPSPTPVERQASVSDDIRRSLDIDEANGLWGRPSGGS